MAKNNRRVHYLLTQAGQPKLALVLIASLALPIWHLSSNQDCVYTNCSTPVEQHKTNSSAPETAALVKKSNTTRDEPRTASADQEIDAEESEEIEKAIQELELLLINLELEFDKHEAASKVFKSENIPSDLSTQLSAETSATNLPETSALNSVRISEENELDWSEKSTIRVPAKKSSWNLQASDNNAISSFSHSLQSIPNYRQTVLLPSCDAVNAIRVNHSSQLSSFVVANYQVICLEPGDYRDAGTIFIETSGSASEPKVLRSTSENDSSVNFENSEQAFLPTLNFDGASHWIVNGLSWSSNNQIAISITSGYDIILNRNRFDQVEQAIAIGGETLNVQLQDSWVQASTNHQGICATVMSQGTSRDLGFVGNQFDGCAKAISVESETGTLSTIVSENDFYHENNSTCSIQGLFLNASAEETSPNTIIGNQFYGWKSDTNCDTLSTAINIASENRYTRIEKNIFNAVQAAIEVDAGAQGLRIENNLITDSAENIEQNNSAALIIAGDTQELAIIGNHIVDSGRWLYLQDDEIDLSCNVVLDGGQALGLTLAEGSVDDNTYFDTNPSNASAPNGSDQLYANVSSAKMSRLCTDLRQLSGSRELCITNALISDESPQRCSSVYWRDSSR